MTVPRPHGREARAGSTGPPPTSTRRSPSSTSTRSTPTPPTCCRRAAGKPIRVASKSVRCRGAARRVLARAGFAGVLAFTLRRGAVAGGGGTRSRRRRGRLPDGRPGGAARGWPPTPARPRAITLMVDDAAQLDLVDASSAAGAGRPLRVCLDLDASLRRLGGRLHVGRAPLPGARRRTHAAALARAVAGRPGFRWSGSWPTRRRSPGVGDAAARRPCAALAVRGDAGAVGRASWPRAGPRRSRRSARSRRWSSSTAAAPAASSARPPRRRSPRSPAGSGLFCPALFDDYRAFAARPAALFALPVVRRPAPGMVTVLGGGWIASGPAGRRPAAGAVPSRPACAARRRGRRRGADAAARRRRPTGCGSATGCGSGTPRPASCASTSTSCTWSQGDAVTGAVPTYRGEGKAFG